MHQWPLVGRQYLALVRPTMPALQLTRPPARPDQFRGLAPGQPAVAGVALLGQTDVDDAAVQSFLGVVADRGAQILKVAAGAAPVDPVRAVGPAGLAGNV